jgi:hypothetical protein
MFIQSSLIKKLKMRKFNFPSIERSILDSKEALAIVGGKTCGCSCYYRNVGDRHSPEITNDTEIKADLPGGTDIW